MRRAMPGRGSLPPGHLSLVLRSRLRHCGVEITWRRRRSGGDWERSLRMEALANWCSQQVDVESNSCVSEMQCSKPRSNQSLAANYSITVQSM